MSAKNQIIEIRSNGKENVNEIEIGCKKLKMAP